MINYPDNYIKNNSPEFYAEIERQVSSDSFHLLFQGVAGCGKTMLADIILSGYGKYRLYNAADFYDDYLELLKCSQEVQRDRLHYYKEAPISYTFLLDDLGCEMDTPASRQFFAHFLQNDYDYAKAGKKQKAIITTNLDHKSLNDRYGSRAIDRMFELYGQPIFKFNEKSFRMANVRVING